MLNGKTLHFSLGPVQSFVAQARRTRDFWTGSFLLSYLSAVAMDYVRKNGGKIVFPAVVDDKGNLDPLLIAIEATRDDTRIEKPPLIGSIPNRFQAIVPDSFNPEGCSKAIEAAWLNIADKVYEEYIKEVEGFGNNTYLIWKRQVKSFWDIVWVVGEEPHLLDYRKNWRSHIPEPEPGDKCTLISNMQEISGYTRVSQGDRQRLFWSKLRGNLASLDLRDDERLCAVALIKRLFPYVATETIGWKVINSFPSTMYLSAIPWLNETLVRNEDLAKSFVDEASKIKNSINKYDTRIKFSENLDSKNDKSKKFTRLDGNLFYHSTLDNDKLWDDDTSETRKILKTMLKNEKVSPFYAFLLMDGDRMGALLQEYPNEWDKISQALSKFSYEVSNIVENNGGIPIFAGGDDVLAFLPLDNAVKTANELRTAYQKSFQELLPNILPEDLLKKATISAAIVYAHNRAPLNLIYSYSQKLLSNKAKDEAGRDALAIAIWKTGGVTIEWVTPWGKLALSEKENLLDELVCGFNEKGFSSSFLYNLRKQFIFQAGRGYMLANEDFVDLLVAEYARTRENINITELRPHMERLVEMMKIYKRNDKGEIYFTNYYNPDGVLVVRFLASKGVAI